MNQFGIVLLFVLCVSTVLVPELPAQVEIVTRNYFPGELEFKELRGITRDRRAEEESELRRVENPLFADVGMTRYAERVYSVDGAAPLAIEVVTTQDSRAAYSLLTLLRKTEISPGPPGDFVSVSDGELLFAQDNCFVRLRQEGGGDLLRRVGVSIGNRIGRREPNQPALVRRLPRKGFVPGSLRYILGRKSMEAFGAKVAGKTLDYRSETELAQARYELDGQSGLLTLVSFATSQIAEDFLETDAGIGGAPPEGGARIYAKRAGPIVGILEGNFDPGSADKVLDSIKYAYSIKWIFDKNSRGNATVWGVPVGILGTVVRSLLLVGILCGASILTGLGIALFRVFLRGYAPHNFLDRPERTEIIRLKINEK